jgi:hypothetical protein
MAKKRLFDPADGTPFPLSRSKLALYLECPRCFWLDRRCGVGRPPGFPLSLNLAVDVLMKKEFDRYRAEAKPHPFMATNVPGSVPANLPDLAAWRNPFKGVRHHHMPSGFIIYGAIDDVWMLCDGQLAVVDYKAAATSKTLSLGDESRAFYRRQLDVYHWTMTGMGLPLAPVAFILWVNARKDRPGLDGRLDFAMSLSPYKPGHEWIEPALVSARVCLMADSPPPPSSECLHCGYRAAARGVEHVVA